MGYLWTKYLKLRFLGLVPLFPDLTRWLGTAALKAFSSNFFPYFQPVSLAFHNSLPGKRKTNEVILLLFVVMTVGVYFRIRDLITATLPPCKKT